MYSQAADLYLVYQIKIALEYFILLYMKRIHINVHIYQPILKIQAVLAEKIERKLYINQDESLNDLQIFIKYYFLLKFLDELVTSFLSFKNEPFYEFIGEVILKNYREQRACLYHM